MISWNDCLIRPNATLEDAISVLDKTALRMVLVVNESLQLLGTITDGDIRRALLEHLPLTTYVEEVMFPSPTVAKPDWAREKMLTVMREKNFLHLPVVNENNVVIGLETLQELTNKRLIDNPVFLMAGGFGKRLYPLTRDCPKPLLRIGEKPILEIILESFIKSGFHNFYISTHFLSEMIREYFGDGAKWGVKIKYIHEDAPLGTAGAMGLISSLELKLPMILMNGDLLTSIDFQGLLEFHENYGGVATMCVRKYEYQIPYGVIQRNGNYLESILEKPLHEYFINAGVYVVSPELVKKVPPNQHIDMPTLFQNETDAGSRVAIFPIHEYWMDIGRPEDFEKAKQIVGLLNKE